MVLREVDMVADGAAEAVAFDEFGFEEVSRHAVWTIDEWQALLGVEVVGETVDARCQIVLDMVPRLDLKLGPRARRPHLTALACDALCTGSAHSFYESIAHPQTVFLDLASIQSNRFLLKRSRGTAARTPLHKLRVVQKELPQIEAG